MLEVVIAYASRTLRLSQRLYCTVLYCTVLYCTVLYCTVLYCTVLYCTVLYCTVLYCTVLYCTVLYCTVLYCTVLYCTVLYCTVLYCTVLYCTVLYCTVLYCTVLYCTREMLAAVSMCTHFRLYLRGEQFTLRTDHRSLRWLQKFRNSDGMLARWYMLLGQFSATLSTLMRMACLVNAVSVCDRIDWCHRRKGVPATIIAG